MHAEGLLELKWHQTSRPALERSIVRLKDAQTLAPSDAKILNDQAVAQIALAERTQQLEPMLRALDLIERAFQQDSADASVRFNRPMIMERLYMMDSAEREWARYLDLDKESKWRAEAEQHLQALKQLADTVTWMLSSLEAAPRGTAQRQVARSPQAARDFCLETLLPKWGRAFLDGNQEDAERLLALAREIAHGFGAGHDQSVVFAVVVISRATQPQRQQLARAHVALGEGILLYRSSAYDPSARRLQVARASLQSLASPAAGWAAYYQAGAYMSLGNYQLADQILKGIQNQTSLNEPALVGKSIWAQGTTQVRRGNFENAVRQYRAAAPHIKQAGENENFGAISYLSSESLLLAGQIPAGRAEAYNGLRLLAPFRRSGYRNNQLTNVAVQARAAGLPYAALALRDEVLAVAHQRQGEVLAWAYRARAGELIALGRIAQAERDLTEALKIAQSLPESGRNRVLADVMIVQAELQVRTDPHAALLTLRSIIDTYRTLKTGVHLPSALFAAAKAALASNNTAVGRGYLEQAIEFIEQQRTTFEKAESRAMLYETVENIFDEVVTLELGDQPADAFEYLERSRAATQSLGAARQPAAATTISKVKKILPDSTVLIEYALLPREIAVWAISARRDTLVRIPVSRDSISALVERFGLESNIPDADASQARAVLFEILIRPLARELKDVRKLAVVPDRELHAVPFISLWDSAAGSNGQFLIENYQVHTLPSAAFLVEAGEARKRPSVRRALIVGNPAIDTAALQLASLTSATAEARSIANLYLGAQLLLDSMAQRNRLLALLPHQTVFHFAGHAVFNSEQPELSYLALAPDNPNESGIIQAREIGNLRLSNLKLVVLSACSTLNPRPTRVGVVAGLAHSFLRAGAPAIVSSLWPVEDQATAELMQRFHVHYVKSGDAAEALRSAQLEALGDENRPERRAIQNWAAFIYTGI